METVNHKIYGEGKIIKKDGKYLTVSFDNGKEIVFSIPASFQTGILVASGPLQEEINKALEIAKEKEQKEMEQKKAAERARTAAYASTAAKSHSTKGKARIEITDNIAKEYETFLIKNGYSVETDNGMPSTVYSYIKAVDTVLEEEHMSWQTLKKEISRVIPIYDQGGAKELIGIKSNKTVINALKRFKEYSEA